MEQLLQQLLEAEILTEETKAELETAISSALEEAVKSAKDETSADVRAELTEQWITERSQLIEAIDSKVSEFMEGELNELKSDIESFRDLEAEYAEKLVEAKAAMADELKSDLKELVEKIDAFLEIRLSAEIEELKEDIDVVRKNEFGRRVFEAFAAEYLAGYADPASVEAQLKEANARLEQAEKQLTESEAKREKMERSAKMSSVLKPLAGRQRDVMEAILKNVDTSNLQEAYDTFIGRVLRETASSEKEDTVLAESEEVSTEDKAVDISEGVVKDGNTDEIITETVVTESAELQKMRKLAGLI